jgi:hypothetical protein
MVVTHLTHNIHRRLAKLMRQIVSFDKSDAMFAGNSAFHFYCVYDHAMHDFFGEGFLFVVEEDDRFDRISIL